MIIGVPKETFPGETRVALVPAAAGGLVKQGHEVRVEAGAGAAAGFPDAEYAAQGAKLLPDRQEVFAADLVFQVRGLGANKERGRADLALLRAGQTLVAFLDPLGEPKAAAELAQTGVRAFSLELIPRITRAQTMDVLSSMATVSGYKAVLLAANQLPRFFPMFMTAAGTVTAAKVLVLGAGVAGLQAIATARRLGAVVSGYDVRPVVKEQVESLGAKFVVLDLDTAGMQDQGGYAKEQSPEFIKRQQAAMAKVVAEQDVVISTALIPGKRAPTLLTKAMIDGMKPGSVVIDLAAERGGNCEYTRPDQVAVEHGVTILGPTNLPATVPYHASQMYAKNATTFFKEITDKKTGALNIDKNNEVVRETLVTEGGQVVHARIAALLGQTPPQPQPQTQPPPPLQEVKA